MANGEDKTDGVWNATSISEIVRRLGELQRTVNGVEATCNNLKIDMAVTQAKFNQLSQERVADQQRISVVEGDVRTLDKHLVSGDWFKGVESRLRVLEDSDVATASATQTQTKSRISSRDWLTFVVAVVVCVATVYTAFHVH